MQPLVSNFERRAAGSNYRKTSMYLSNLEFLATVASLYYEGVGHSYLSVKTK